MKNVNYPPTENFKTKYDFLMLLKENGRLKLLHYFKTINEHNGIGREKKMIDKANIH